MYTYYTIMSALQQDAGENSLPLKFPYHWFKASWYHYLSLLDIDYESGFKCPNCDVDGTPNIIICDATSLSFRRDLQEVPDFDIPSQGYVLDGR